MWLWLLVGVHNEAEKEGQLQICLPINLIKRSWDSTLMSSSDPNDLPKDPLPNTVNVVLKFPTVKS